MWMSYTLLCVFYVSVNDFFIRKYYIGLGPDIEQPFPLNSRRLLDSPMSTKYLALS